MTIKLFIFSTLSLSAATGFGQNIAKIKLDNRQSILNDRAFFQFPAEAKNIARQSDIMSADPNTNKETRLIFDIGKQRLVFFARELFVTSDKNLLAAISKDNGNATSRVLTDRDSLLTVLSTPTKYDTAKNAILVNSLYVKTQDNCIFLISAYINPDAFKNKSEFQELSENVFASISKGNRRLNYKTRTEKVPVFEGKKYFSIGLPEGFILSKDKKYDFEVLNFQKIKNIADTNWLSLTIYLGNHPSYFYGDYNLDQNDAEKAKGVFLGENVEWLYFRIPGKPLYLKEQQIPADKIEAGLIVHIAMLGNTPAGIEELTRLIETIQLTGQ